MRADLDEQRRLIDELREQCAAMESLLADNGAAMVGIQADNERLRRRLEACGCGCEDLSSEG